MSFLQDSSLILVFAYAPAGLGHLRVTDALYHALPNGTASFLLGSQDKAITVIHRIISIHPFFRNLMEWVQQGGIAETLFTHLYKAVLKKRTRLLYQQMVTILDERIEPPHTLLVIATHFGLAHQLAAIKDKLSREKNVKVILVVQVTDDSDQQIWYVEGADIIFVPSSHTKKMLEGYGRKMGYAHERIEVTPYPISVALGKQLSHTKYLSRIQQLDISQHSTIHVLIPLSGAAIGMDYFTGLIDNLHRISHRFQFHVVSKYAPYTQNFIKRMSERPFVSLYLSSTDKEILHKYEEVYQTNVISLEITKPSEQAFKALYTPRQIGGSILLFSESVGRQEYENMEYLKRHGLLPYATLQDKLFHFAENNISLQQKQHQSFRALALPFHSQKAAQFIWWCLREKIFYTMAHYKRNTKNPELRPDGVTEFWGKVEAYLHGN